MHDQVLLRVGYGVAHVGEEAQARAHVEAQAVAVGRQRGAFHELHREVGPAEVGRACVDEVGDVRMLEAGQEALLAGEAAAQAGREEGRPDDLEGDFLAHVVAHGAVDGAHAALPLQAKEAVGT